MSYAIEQFTCSNLGLQMLESYEQHNIHQLSADEIKSLWLIENYQALQGSKANKKINSIEVEFQRLYLSVNLSRLVALKLIFFKPKAKEMVSEHKESAFLKNTKSSVSDATNVKLKDEINQTTKNKKRAIKSIVKPLNHDLSLNATAKITLKDKSLEGVEPAILLASGMV